MALPREVVRKDHRLEKEAETSATALAELRWHWTMDDSNPKRVSISEYARSVGRVQSVINRSANAFAVLRKKPELSMSDARTHANLSADRLAAVEAVAKARGVTLETAEHKRRTETRRVWEIAAEKAEQKGTSVEAEAQTVANFIVKAEKADANTKAARRQKVDLRLIEAQAKLQRSMRLNLEVVEIIRAVDWNEEAAAELEADIANQRAIVNLMDVALVGAVDIDWDKELAKLEATS